MATKPIVYFHITRPDGVGFIYNKFSPNGTEINSLTAGDDFWASVPVGKFATAVEAFAAIETFEMPAREV